MIGISRCRKRVFLLLDPIDGRLDASKRSRVLGPFRVVQFNAEGIWASADPYSPEQVATSNEAGYYVLPDGTEWFSARTVSPSLENQFLLSMNAEPRG